MQNFYPLLREPITDDRAIPVLVCIVLSGSSPTGNISSNIGDNEKSVTTYKKVVVPIITFTPQCDLASEPAIAVKNIKCTQFSMGCIVRPSAGQYPKLTVISYEKFLNVSMIFMHNILNRTDVSAPVFPLEIFVVIILQSFSDLRSPFS